MENQAAAKKLPPLKKVAAPLKSVITGSPLLLASSPQMCSISPPPGSQSLLKPTRRPNRGCQRSISAEISFFLNKGDGLNFSSSHMGMKSRKIEHESKVVCVRGPLSVFSCMAVYICVYIYVCV